MPTSIRSSHSKVSRQHADVQLQHQTLSCGSAASCSRGGLARKQCPAHAGTQGSHVKTPCTSSTPLGHIFPASETSVWLEAPAAAQHVTHLLLAVVFAQVKEVVDVCMPRLQVQRKSPLALAASLVHIPGAAGR